MTLSPKQWKQLQHLRQAYVEGSRSLQRDYWQSRDLLQAYDRTLAARIGWKWTRMLEDLHAKQWLPWKQIRSLVDWGCGTGQAARTVVDFAHAHLSHRIENLYLFDRSRAAQAYAQDQLRRVHPGLNVHTSKPVPCDLLLLSHVINELQARDLAQLKTQLRQSRWILWVEAGSVMVSHKLSQIRDQLLEEFEVLAPCPHQLSCPAQSERLWRHFFAKPPPEVFHDAFWSEVENRLHINIRSVPYSFLYLQNRSLNDQQAGCIEAVPPQRVALAKPFKKKQYVCLSSGSCILIEKT